MKKGWKIFGIICAAMAGLGFVLCIAGFAIGITVQEIEDAFRDGVGFHPYNTHKIVTVERIDMAEEADDRFDAGIISDIEMKVGKVQVEVSATDGEEIIVEHQVDERLKFECYKEGTTLVLKTKSGGKYVKNGGNIFVYIPKHLLVNEMDLKIGAGTLEMTDVNVRELKLSCGAAAVDMVNVAADNVDIECGAGQIEYVAAGQETDYNYKVEIGAGEVSVGDSSFSGLAVDKKINNGANKNMSIECGAGQVNVSFEQ